MLFGYLREKLSFGGKGIVEQPIEVEFSTLFFMVGGFEDLPTIFVDGIVTKPIVIVGFAGAYLLLESQPEFGFQGGSKGV